MGAVPVTSRHRQARTTLAVLLGAGALALSGCGGGSGGTSAEGGDSASTSEIVTRGPKGERIGGEAASSLHLSAADCKVLRRRAEAQLGHPLAVFSEPTAPSSRCRFTAPGATIGVYLDSGRSAHQRYLNRMVEQDQFGAPDPGRVAHPVAGVGDPAPGNQNASWVPDLGSLFASRGNRWLTVTYAVTRVANPEARRRAVALARLGFRLSSG